MNNISEMGVLLMLSTLAKMNPLIIPNRMAKKILNIITNPHVLRSSEKKKVPALR